MDKKQFGVTALLIFLLCGCVTLGKKFNYEHVSSLRLGALSRNECREAFGAPYRASSEKNLDGSFEKLVYYFSNSNIFDSLSTRTLHLEFKDEMLNAYDYVSSFDKDKTKVTIEGIDKIKIGQSSKTDALKLLGEPTGKALCPTTLYSLKDKCENGGEMWVWRQNSKFSIYNPEAENKTEIYLIFDKNSMVVDINTYKSTPEAK
ncbi:MAG: hypothetical protein KBA46_04195 [Candidatus Omnitrophica bacterium]|nr:hypothetical protein [Candidatus Omnitrophota bacterium]